MEIKKNEKPSSLSPVKPALKREDEGKSSRSGSKIEKELKLPAEKSPSDDSSRKERRLSRASDGSKDTIERQDSRTGSLSPKVSRKYFTNWKQACDKTKDKTKELLKRWRTLPESELGDEMQTPASEDDKPRGWSVHVWTTWVNRCSEDLECLDLEEEQPLATLSSVQTDKMTLFFTELLDHDRDDVICDQDFDNFFERLAHFADWSPNSSEFHILLEVKSEFIEHFINPLPSKWADLPYYKKVCGPEASGINMPGRTTLEGWLARWALHLSQMKRFSDLPLYLQYLCKILFHVVDRTNTGEITKPALAAFYRSVIGVSAARIDEVIDTAYDRMTSPVYNSGQMGRESSLTVCAAGDASVIQHIYIMSKSKDPTDKIEYYMEKIRKLQSQEARRSSRGSSSTRNQDIIAEELENLGEIQSLRQDNSLINNSSPHISPPSPGELPASPDELSESPASPKALNEPVHRNEPVTRPETLKARILRNESITVVAQNTGQEPIMKILQPPTLTDEHLERSSYSDVASRKVGASSKVVGANFLKDNHNIDVHVNKAGISEVRSFKRIPRKCLETVDSHKSKNEPKACEEMQGSSSSRREHRTSSDKLQGHSSKKEPRTILETSGAYSSKKRHRPCGEPLEEHSRKTPRTTSETSDAHDSDNDNSPDIATKLELALGDDLTLGEDINSNLVKVLDPILRKGLSADQEEKLLKAYCTPANCRLLKAPILNEEISSNFLTSARIRDKKMEMKQDQLGLGITAISRAITLLIKHESDSNTTTNNHFKIDAIKHLNHGCRLLADLHYKETKMRKYFCSRELAAFRDLKFNHLERDDTLYGSKLARMIKKQGIPMERARPFQSHGDQGYQRNGFSNYNPPSPPRRGEPRSPPRIRHNEI